MIKHSIEKLLINNSYPGRGIIIGRSEDNTCAVMVYFIMGRSVNSRNRIFEKTPDGIRTTPHDPAKMTDPSLVIYNPVRFTDGMVIVTNGDQTDTVLEFLKNGQDFQSALRTREFEPDAPNYTPRISGLIKPDGAYTISMLKSSGGAPHCIRSFFEYSAPIAGIGHFISTYQNDGNPLPSFEGEPVTVDIVCANGIKQFANDIWGALNEENKVSLYACQMQLSDGEINEIIINKL